MSVRFSGTWFSRDGTPGHPQVPEKTSPEHPELNVEGMLFSVVHDATQPCAYHYTRLPGIARRACGGRWLHGPAVGPPAPGHCSAR